MKEPSAKSDVGWKLLQIVSSRVQAAPVLFDFKKFESEEEEAGVLKELELLVRKFKLLSVKVNERVPVVSRQPGHKWYLTKDKYGAQYMIYTQTFFDEKIVFKVQTKIMRLLDHYYDNIVEGNKISLEQFRQRSLEYLEQYNSIISRTTNNDLMLSQMNSVVEIVPVEPKPLNLAQRSEDVVLSSTNNDDIFHQMEKRQERLKLMQCVTIFAMIFALGLGVLDLFQQMEQFNQVGGK